MRKKNLLFFFSSLVSLSASALAKDDVTIAGRGYCGDGVLNGNEECDGNDLNFVDCSRLNGGGIRNIKALFVKSPSKSPSIWSKKSLAGLKKLS